MNEELLKRLDVLAAKLGVTAQYLWGAMLRQSRIEALQDSAFVAICVLIIALMVRLCRWAWSADDDKYPCVFLIGASFSIAIMAFAAAIITASSIPTEALNPEYFALDRLLHLMGGQL